MVGNKYQGGLLLFSVVQRLVLWLGPLGKPAVFLQVFTLRLISVYNNIIKERDGELNEKDWIYRRRHNGEIHGAQFNESRF